MADLYEFLKTANPVPPNPWATFRQGGREMFERYAPNAIPWLKKNGPAMAVGAGLAATGYTAYQGARAAGEQEARMQDYLGHAHHMMPQPMPSMSVYAAYDEFAAEKKAELRGEKTAAPIRSGGFDPYGSVQGEFAKSFGGALAQKFVTEPIDTFHRTLRKKLIDDPKANDTFHSVIQDDDMLRDAYQQNPERMEQTFKAMRKFGPSMSTTPAAVRSFLRQSAMAGNNMDFATIRLLAETEKFVQNSRGQGK